MDEIEPGRKRITLSGITRYVFGVIFLLFGIVHLSLTHYIAGILFIFAAIVTIKPSMDYVEKRLNISMSGTANFFVVFCLVIVALVAVPQVTSPPGNSDETIASQSSAGDDINTAVVNSETTHTTAPSDTGSIPFVGTYYKCGSWSNEQYPLITLFGENYVPLLPSNEKIWNDRVNKLSKLVLDLPSEGEKYALKTGEILDLGQGYGLEAKQIDVDGQMVWFELTKDGTYVGSEIIKVGNGNDGTWSLSLDDIQGVSNVVVFKVHVNGIFEGAVDSIVQMDGIWLIDYVNATTLEVGDRLGNVTLTKIVNGVDKSDLGSLVFEPSDASSEQTTRRV